jgi:hypothetical protein
VKVVTCLNRRTCPTPGGLSAACRTGGPLDADEDLRWRTFGERIVYDNPWVRLVLVDVQPPHGERFEHHVARLQAVVLAVVQRGGSNWSSTTTSRSAPVAMSWPPFASAWPLSTPITCGSP